VTVRVTTGDFPEEVNVSVPVRPSNPFTDAEAVTTPPPAPPMTDVDSQETFDETVQAVFDDTGIATVAGPPVPTSHDVRATVNSGTTLGAVATRAYWPIYRVRAFTCTV